MSLTILPSQIFHDICLLLRPRTGRTKLLISLDCPAIRFEVKIMSNKHVSYHSLSSENYCIIVL